MDIEKFEEWSMDYLSGNMDIETRKLFDRFLKDHPEYQDKLKEFDNTWGVLNELEAPETSLAMDDAFYEMLSDTIKKEQVNTAKSGWFENLISQFMALIKPQMAYGMLLLLAGVGLGYFFNSTDSNTTTVAEINTNVENSADEASLVREKLVLTLLEQPSAKKRLEGVNEANKLKNVEEKVIQALLKTLNNDANVNVRLAAIASLTQFVEHPQVREGLVKSITQQESPIVQITLANLMEILQEKKSVEPFKELLKTQKLDTTVKQKIEHSIKAII